MNKHPNPPGIGAEVKEIKLFNSTPVKSMPRRRSLAQTSLWKRV